MSGTDPAFASGFPAADEAAWRALADKALKGAPFEKKLVARTFDGLALPALARRAGGRAPLPGRSPATPWVLAARIDLPDPDAANAQALDDLTNNASGLALVFAGAPSAHGFGLTATSVDDLDRILEDVRLDLIQTRIEAGADAPRVAELFMELAARRGHDAPDASLGLDPIGLSAATGGTFAAALSGLFGHGTVRLLRADGRVHHAAGAGAAQELAAMQATVLAYARGLMDAGLSAHEALTRIDVTLAADADQFETIAKMRAARLLWAALARELGAPDARLHLHAETAWRMMTRRDVHVNLLRATIAAFAAGVGGADSVAVLPFTQGLGLPDGFARRLARNTQSIIVEESNLHRVADPGAGSGTVEAFTDALAEAAWDLFREIERRGGMSAALASGWWTGEVARIREARAKDIAMRKAPLTGVSEFPLLEETSPDVLAAMPIIPEAAGDPVSRNTGQSETPVFLGPGSALRSGRDDRGGVPLPAMRLSEPFERLRDAADAMADRPAVFLATLGGLAAFTPRASFARNLFAAGGLGAPGGAVYADTAALVAAFKASGARLACLCGTDEAYATRGTEVARALTEAGATVWLAGRPEAALEKAGVSGFVFAGCDVLAALKTAHGIIAETLS